MMHRIIRLLTSRRTWVLMPVVVIPCLLVWYFSEESKDAAYQKGVNAATEDGRRGHDEVQGLGYPPPPDNWYARLLKEKYGVNLNWVAGCIVTEQQRAYVYGYNSVSQRRLTEKFGRDIFHECSEEAQARYLAQNPAGQK